MRRTSIKQLAGLPTVQAGLTRLAAARLQRAGVKLEPLMSRTGVTRTQIEDVEQRISAQAQVAFLEAASEALEDDFLGLTLAREADFRDLGLLYYVSASSETLGDALRRLGRYSRIANEAVVFDYREARAPVQRLRYSGVARHTDRHQIEFCILGVVRMCRLLTGRNFVPTRVSMAHVRSNGTAEYDPLSWDRSRVWQRRRRDRFPGGLGGDALGRGRSSTQQDTEQGLRGHLKRAREQCQRAAGER